MNTKLSNEHQQDFEAIVKRINSEESDERRRAIFELENYDADTTIDLLVVAIQDEHRAVRAAASEVLVALPSGVCTHRLTPLLGSERIEVRNVVAAILVKYGESAVHDLIQALIHENEDVRKFSADILGLARNIDAVESLCESALTDKVQTVIESAIEALGKIGDSSALPTLYQIYASHNGFELVTIEAIGLIGNPNSVQFLVQNLNSEDPMIIFAIIDALGNIGSNKALDPMNIFLVDAPNYLRSQTLSTVLKIGQSSDTLILTEQNTDIIKIVIKELKDIESKITPLILYQLDLSPGDKVLHLLFEYSDELPESILVGLIKTCKNRSGFLDDISNLVNHQDDWVSYTAIETLGDYEKDQIKEILLAVLKNSQGIRILAAMKIVAKLKLAEARVYLEALAQDEDEDIRSNASRILISLREGQ